jgi:hypothetical protein
MKHTSQHNTTYGPIAWDEMCGLHSLKGTTREVIGYLFDDTTPTGNPATPWPDFRDVRGTVTRKSY